MNAVAAAALAAIVVLGTPLAASPQPPAIQTPRPPLRTTGGHAAALALRAQAAPLQAQADRQFAVAAAYRRNAAGWQRGVARLERSIQLLGSNPANAAKVREARSQIPVLRGKAERALSSARRQDGIARTYAERAHRLLVEAAIADSRP